MNRFFNFVNTYQATLLSVSLAVMVSSSFFFMIEAFNHMA